MDDLDIRRIAWPRRCLPSWGFMEDVFSASLKGERSTASRHVELLGTCRT